MANIFSVIVQPAPKSVFYFLKEITFSCRKPSSIHRVHVKVGQSGRCRRVSGQGFDFGR